MSKRINYVKFDRVWWETRAGGDSHEHIILRTGHTFDCTISSIAYDEAGGVWINAVLEKDEREHPRVPPASVCIRLDEIAAVIGVPELIGPED